MTSATSLAAGGRRAGRRRRRPRRRCRDDHQRPPAPRAEPRAPKTVHGHASPSARTISRSSHWQGLELPDRVATALDHGRGDL